MFPSPGVDSAPTESFMSVHCESHRGKSGCETCGHLGLQHDQRQRFLCTTCRFSVIRGTLEIIKPHQSSWNEANRSMAQQRFLTLSDVSEILSISVAQARAMVRSGELPAIQVGGRGQWRVETQKLEEYIQKGYERTEQAVREGSIG